MYQEQYTGYYEDPEAPELSDSDIEEAYLEMLQQEAADLPGADFSYELSVDAIWEREAA